MIGAHNDPRASSLYLALGQCMGLLATEAVYVALVDALRDPHGLRPEYIKGLRDVLSRALRESAVEPEGD